MLELPLTAPADRSARHRRTPSPRRARRLSVDLAVEQAGEGAVERRQNPAPAPQAGPQTPGWPDPARTSLIATCCSYGRVGGAAPGRSLPMPPSARWRTISYGTQDFASPAAIGGNARSDAARASLQHLLHERGVQRRRLDELAGACRAHRAATTDTSSRMPRSGSLCRQPVPPRASAGWPSRCPVKRVRSRAPSVRSAFRSPHPSEVRRRGPSSRRNSIARAHRPLALDRPGRQPHHFGGLVDAQPAEEAQLDDAALTRIDLLQFQQRAIQRKHVDRMQRLRRRGRRRLLGVERQRRVLRRRA